MISQSVVIIDYNLGNPLSIQNMLKRLGCKAVISNKPDDLFSADKLILPGVGHFAAGMKNLEELGLIELLNELVLVKSKPILGICLGMQLMTSFSEEGNVEGLNWIDAKTKLFRFENTELKVPHMGWNDTLFLKEPFSSLKFSENPSRFYYVHSYFVDCDSKEDVLCTAYYGKDFVSGFNKKNIFGVQFHPEKSHVFGQTFFNLFLEL